MEANENNLKNKIDALFQFLGCNNSVLARYADCSPSEISRLHSGSRKHKADSKPMLRFSEGLCAYADKNHLGGELAKLLKVYLDAETDLPAAVIAWLYDPNAPIPEVYPAQKRSQRGKKHTFSERLGAVMGLLELSNVRLAQAINVDASTISRFRSGLRLPTHPISELLVSALLSRAQMQNKTGALAALCRLPEERLKRGNDEFSDWLYSSDITPTVSEISTLLGDIDKAIRRAYSPNNLPAELMKDSNFSESERYFGTQGLREASIRFLTNTTKQGGELWLYSDQNTDWQFGDEQFTAKWAVLMVACLQAKVKMRIIHNVDRNTGEMISAIKNWLPLYLTGLIEPYACSAQQHDRFSHTIFLRPKAECIYGFSVCGSEKDGWYDYITDGSRLDAITEEFEVLLKKSSPLAKIHSGEAEYFKHVTLLSQQKDSNPAYRHEMLPELTYPNLEIVLTDGAVNVLHTKAPYVAFEFFDMRMHRAFQEYLRIL